MKPLARARRLAALAALWAVLCVNAQEPGADARMMHRGELTRDGRSVAYRIRYLPVSSYPELPAGVARELTERGCLIPQTYEAHRPENVIHGSFERSGSRDWAALCAREGVVKLLVFFGDAEGKAMELARFGETERLQENPGTSELGFNWGIDTASPARVHDAQIGMQPRPARLEHDAVADSVVDRRTEYRVWSGGSWRLAEVAE